jgi:hypothetical protein
LFRTRREQIVVELTLRPQLATYSEEQLPPRLTAVGSQFPPTAGNVSIFEPGRPDEY